MGSKRKWSADSGRVVPSIKYDVCMLSAIFVYASISVRDNGAKAQTSKNKLLIFKKCQEQLRSKTT